MAASKKDVAKQQVKEDREKVREMYLSGKTVKEIAKETYFSSSYCYAMVRDLAKEKNFAKKAKRAPLDEAMIQDAKAGMTVAEIAKKHGVTYQQCYYTVSEYAQATIKKNKKKQSAATKVRNAAMLEDAKAGMTDKEIAKKYFYDRHHTNCGEIIAMKKSFHGRSMGALSLTGKEAYQTPFGPMITHIRFAEFNNLDSVRSLITENTCAICLETVQGEGGIYPAEPEFLQGVRKLCDEHDILLILDEIQCGMGRTGNMFACQAYGVQPDVMTCAKALGCGVPVGAFVLNEKTANASLVPGDHGTTYGGNPLACAAVSKVFDLFESEKIVEHVNKVAPYLEKKLDQLVEKYDFITTRRGKGLMQGLVLEGKPVGEVVTKAIENGLLVISAGTNVLRMVPPLVITEADVDEMIEKLEKALV